MAVAMFIKVLFFSLIVSINAFVLEINGKSNLNGLKKTISLEEMLAGGGNCSDDAECEYEGICKFMGSHSSCACRQGLDGDYCEIVVDCESGKYRNCKGVNGTCVYSTQKEEAICACSGNQIFDPNNNICKELRCEKIACRGGTCKVIGAKEICRCPKKHILYNDTCVECDCGVTRCELSKNGVKKPCLCNEKQKLFAEKCVDCDCGDAECKLTEDGIKDTCSCSATQKVFNGKCVNCDCGDAECKLTAEGIKDTCSCNATQIFNGKCVSK